MAIEAKSDELLAQAVSTLEASLPPAWRVRRRVLKTSALDAVLSVETPEGTRAEFGVEIKRRFEPRDADIAAARLRRAHPGGPNLLIAPFLSQRSRTLLRDEGVSYLDLTGNARLACDRPPFFIERSGSDKNPAASERPRSSLRGPVTGSIIRYICDVRPPLKVRAIAMGARTNAGNVSRVLDFLESERLIERGRRHALTGADWKAIIQFWARDLERQRASTAFLEPRGIDETLRRLKNWQSRYSLTGQYAAAQKTGLVDPVSLDIYVESIEKAQAELGLRLSERVGNVRLIRAFGNFVFERPLQTTPVVLAGASQIAADLLTLPHRTQDEHAAFVKWMDRHEDAWRVS